MGFYIYLAAFAVLVAAYLILGRALGAWRKRLSSFAWRVESYRRAYRKVESKKETRRRRLIRSLSYLEREYARNPENRRLGRLLMSLYAAQRDSSKLRGACVEFLKRYPDDDLAASVAFALAGDEEFFKAASSEYEKAVAGTPGKAAIWLNLASLRHARSSRCAGEERERYAALAEEAFRRALDLSPEDAGILWSYGSHLQTTGKLDEGLALLQRARNPAPELTLQIGRLLAKLGRPEAAEIAFVDAARREEERLGRTGPVASASYGEVGKIALERGREDDALGWLRKQTPSEPHTEFITHGPDLGLASALLDRGIGGPEIMEYVRVALLFSPDRKDALELKSRLDATSQGKTTGEKREGCGHGENIGGCQAADRSD